jgi:chromosome segregation and condensation protein ScpB
MLANLVGLQLLRIERPEGCTRPPRYHTTERFLRLFGLESLDDLPQTEDLDTRL